MFIDKDSLSINGVSMGKYITQVTYGYHKLWSSDTGRNLAGTNSGTLIGVFPKLTLEFRPLTKAEVELLVPILDSPRQNTTYYDPNKKKSITIATYTGDYEIVDKKIIEANKRNEGFNISFIAISKRV